MEQRKIGSLEVSVIGLGCNNFGRQTDESESIAVVNAALDSGINFFDTADVYGNTESEQILGKALKSRRSEAFIATKFGVRRNDENGNPSNGPGSKSGTLDYVRPLGIGGGTPEYVRIAVEGCLKRLDVEEIDLFQIHWPDESTPISETVDALSELVTEGKVREIGCSNFSAGLLTEALTSGPIEHNLVSAQSSYSLLNRAIEAEIMPVCDRFDLAVIPYFPLYGGLLSGKYQRGVPPPEGTRMAEPPGRRIMPNITDTELDILDQLVAFAELRGHTVLELAFSWLISHPQVASVIAGARTGEQAAVNARAAAWVLTEDEIAEVDRLTRKEDSSS